MSLGPEARRELLQFHMALRCPDAASPRSCPFQSDGGEVSEAIHSVRWRKLAGLVHSVSPALTNV